MTLATAEQIDRTVSYEFISGFGVHKGSVWITPFGTATIHHYEGRCDHETCYETHDTQLVFSIGDRYFLKVGTYDSMDGFQWNKPLREVKPVEKTITDWEVQVPKVWDAAGISAHILEWFKSQRDLGIRGAHDWVSLYYAAENGCEITSLPWKITAVETWEDHEPESNGPVWLIFEINGEHYAAKGKNVSHYGWDFDGAYALEKVEKKTITKEVWA